MELRTQRLQIRLFSQRDLCDMHAYCAQKGVGENAGWAAHQSLAESAEVLAGWVSEGRKHAIVWRKTGRVIGHISVDPDSEENRPDTRELGCALHPQYHRRGVMTEAIHAVLAFLFEEEAIQYVWACCFQHNVPSKKMIEKCGFLRMGEGAYFSSSLNHTFPSYEYRLSNEEWRAQKATRSAAPHTPQE